MIKKKQNEYTNVKDYLILYKFLCCNKFDENLKKRFANTSKKVFTHMNT